MHDKTNNKWIHKQTLLNLSQFDESMEKNYPETRKWVKDPQKSYQRICVDCNYMAAIELIDWDGYLKKNSTLLDLAGGTGWLSAHLSKFSNVEKIYFLDSSRFYIENMMPDIVKIMHGIKNKIETIEGFFHPLLFENSFLDMIVVSSSLHHADNLEIVLKEISRVLKDDGYLFILNETPLSNTRYLLVMLKRFIRMYVDTILRNYKSESPSISSNGVLYDPVLGDRIYPMWYWNKAISMSGMRMEDTIDTKLPTVKGEKGIHLRHFFCRK